MSQSSTTSSPTARTKPLPLPFVNRIDDDGGECAEYYARTRREQRMCALLNAVRDKPNWACKWRDAEIRAKLTAEMKEAAAATSWPVPVVGRFRRVGSDDEGR
ncbi:hypothetical protein AMAG_19382 [Allomyces macrogynus ATCC 38327]|uniref:DUF4246 domain-containing protein n=1 Tax=Allomyces macrogynus (strain ATCC 38327) TaxID=578462 RepID=A0A0L0SUU7_ALLM3|nr:hypothetical protein AMAG_19382 [Allomyces macrogynus ATCC 38327]|eukprot:KNE66292.1 hypothetical protein AMAG_19382 [Allomyces macrogynus ATCC 38327]